eukprot:Sspe_Gene.37094::Locus_17905_Transcript_1_1_Confidence_1.000_Length_1850::g.37094::m.37094
MPSAVATTTSSQPSSSTSTSWCPRASFSTPCSSRPNNHPSRPEKFNPSHRPSTCSSSNAATPIFPAMPSWSAPFRHLQPQGLNGELESGYNGEVVRVVHSRFLEDALFKAQHVMCQVVSLLKR